MWQPLGGFAIQEGSGNCFNHSKVVGTTCSSGAPACASKRPRRFVGSFDEAANRGCAQMVHITNWF